MPIHFDLFIIPEKRNAVQKIGNHPIKRLSQSIAKQLPSKAKLKDQRLFFKTSIVELKSNKERAAKERG